MSEEVRDLGQQLVAAAWDAARLSAPDVDAVRLGEVLECVEETQAQLAGLRMRLIRQAQAAAAYPVIDQVRISSRTTTQQASADLKLAADLGESFELIAAAVSAGTVSLAQARAMVQGMKSLPVKLSRAESEQCQAELVARAEVLGPHELRALAVRMVELLDPVAAEDEEAKRLEREERRARAGRNLRIKPDHHGSMRITGQLPVAEGALLQAQIEALMPPVSAYAHEDFTPHKDARRADALVALTGIAANSGALPAHGLDRPHVHITLDLDALTTGLGRIGVLGSTPEQQITASEARRLACDAHLIPIVLGGESRPLDVGRDERVVPKGMRAALTLRDRGCVFPHCAATPQVCEAHHIVPWWDGGVTSLANAMLLCPHHHRLVEPDPQQSADSQWQARISHDTGLPEFIPPTHIDAARRPRQHRRFYLPIKNLMPDDLVAGMPRLRKPLVAVRASDTRVMEPAPRESTDDPWHPDYQPPPRMPPPPVNEVPWIPGLPHLDPKDDPWHPDYQTPPGGT